VGSRAKSWREAAKATAKVSQALRRRQSNAKPARKNRPARAGTDPREGKALEGRSRDASGMKEGREASGATANGGVERPRTSRVLAGTVERGKNPEDGTDGSLATPVPHGRPKGSAWWRRGTRRRTCPWEQEPQERRTRRHLERLGSFLKGTGRRRGERAEAKPEHSEEAPNPTRADRGTLVPRQGPTRKTPRSSRTTRGERRKPIKRYSPDTRRP